MKLTRLKNRRLQNTLGGRRGGSWPTTAVFLQYTWYLIELTISNTNHPLQPMIILLSPP